MDVDASMPKTLDDPIVTHELYREIRPIIQEGDDESKICMFTSACLFPWTILDFNTLWDGSLPAQTGEDGQRDWARLVEQFADVALLGGMGTMTICSTFRQHFRTTLTFAKLEREPVLASGWALKKDNPFAPLAVFSLGSYVLVHDIQENKLLSVLRGHGGLIHAIAVHPSEPHLFCTTSRDFTTRIYNLNLKAANSKDDIRLNPIWSPCERHPSKGGAPHGLRASEPEGYNPQAPDANPRAKKSKVNKPAPIGRCVKILVGSRAAGHQQPVLCAAWHPTVPAIATGGLDRSIKIWRAAPLPEDGSISREDKPLFSCVELHRAGVMSVAWVGEDTLITHDRPARMNSKGQYEPGAVSFWKWNSFRRFFPVGQEEGWHTQPDLVGVAADFSESASFEIITRLDLPQQRSALGARVYNDKHLYPVLAIPLQHSIRLLAPGDLPLYDRQTAVPPLEGEEDVAIAHEMGNLSLTGGRSRSKETARIITKPGEEATLLAVDMSLTGRLIIGVDDMGRAWVWVGSCDFARVDSS
ncbi:unnamed protein product [Peniophora sp. CBMAI 1063]|nr:unnamed protein product [Peniophora sp. CBMAI 1063]